MSTTVPPRITGLDYVQPLGAGGYADVFLYQQQMPRMRVAVKVLKTDGMTPSIIRQFNDEADTMAELSDHPFIVQVFSSGTTEDGRPYLVMKYYPPPNLAARARAERFPVQEVLRTGVQLASAVETAHRAGILHRDIKPANVLVSQYGTPGLTDFGIAGRGAAGEEPDDDVGVSVPWAPPEVLFGQSNGDVRGDVYSLGATLWQLLVGRSPFEVPGGDNGTSALMPRIRSNPPPATGRPDVPPSLERLLAQAMAKNPASRPPTAIDLARSLQSIEQEQRYPRTAVVVPDEPGAAEATGASTSTPDRTRLRALPVPVHGASAPAPPRAAAPPPAAAVNTPAPGTPAPGQAQPRPTAPDQQVPPRPVTPQHLQQPPAAPTAGAQAPQHPGAHRRPAPTSGQDDPAMAPARRRPVQPLVAGASVAATAAEEPTVARATGGRTIQPAAPATIARDVTGGRRPVAPQDPTVVRAVGRADERTGPPRPASLVVSGEVGESDAEDSTVRVDRRRLEATASSTQQRSGIEVPVVPAVIATIVGLLVLAGLGWVVTRDPGGPEAVATETDVQPAQGLTKPSLEAVAVDGGVKFVWTYPNPRSDDVILFRSGRSCDDLGVAYENEVTGSSLTQGVMPTRRSCAQVAVRRGDVTSTYSEPAQENAR